MQIDQDAAPKDGRCGTPVRRKRVRRTHRKFVPPTRDMIDGRSAARALFDRIESAVVSDLGGEGRVSAIGLRLISAFCGAAILVESLNVKILTGQDVDPAEFGQVASCLVRIGSRLGLGRVPKEVESLQQYLARVYGDGQVDEEAEAAEESDIAEPQS